MKILPGLLSRFVDRLPLLQNLIGAASLAVLFSCSSVAQEVADPVKSSGVWSITSENDIFGGTDRNYSNGIRIERVSPANKVNPVLDWAADRIPFLNIKRKDMREGWALSHTIFTPEDISVRVPDPNDRPYAAWLYLSGTVVAKTKAGNIQDVLQVNLGVVGPLAAGEFVQQNWHDLIQVGEPQGWASQLRNEPGIEIIAQRMHKFKGPELPFGLASDYGLHGGVTLGNVRTYGAIGAMARIGWDLEADFGPPRIRPALAGAGTFDPGRLWGGYLFAGFEGRAVARDIFLDGNLWRDSARVSDRRDLVADLQWGVAIHRGDVQLAFTFVHRTEEFIAQAGPQRFGAVSISIAH